jgi:uncharacterized protein (TIGR02117 family)
MRLHGGAFIEVMALAVLLAACRSEGTSPRPGPVDETEAVYLVGHGWHAGLVIPRTPATAAHWPEQAAFPYATSLEVGWGDRDFYQDPNPGVGREIKAALWPTRSVLHVVGFSRPVTAYFPHSEIVRLDLTRTAVDSLAAYVHAAYARGEEGRPFPLGPGLYGESRFYAARERYYFFKNCNRWTARALRVAGLPLYPSEVLTTGDLFKQARPFGETIQHAD